MPAENTALLKRIAGLPLFPATALRLLTLSTESASAIQDFEAAYKADAALAADLLMAANSLEFGLQARVESIRQAVVLLGLDRVNALSVTIAMKYYMRAAPRMRVMQPLWSHGVATAVIAEAMGASRGKTLAGLYTAGLLHDVGRLGLLMEVGQPYADALIHPVASMEDALLGEKEQFGVSHTEAGAVMAGSWGFPALLCDAIHRHHEEGDAATEERLRIVQQACRWASALGYGEYIGTAKPDREAALPELAQQVQTNLALDPTRLRLRITGLLFDMAKLATEA